MLPRHLFDGVFACNDANIFGAQMLPLAADDFK
jgi:hypothetical protein